MIERVAAAVLAVPFLVGLAACGGGGGGGSANPGPTPPGPTPTPPPSAAGPFAIDGIDRIPQSMLKLSKTQMQSRWVIGDIEAHHASSVGITACGSYVEGISVSQCGLDRQAGKTRGVDRTVTSRTGSTPFTMLVEEGAYGKPGSNLAWIVVGDNCKSDIRDKPKLNSFGLSIPGHLARSVGFPTELGAGRGCTDGRPGCC